MRNSLKMDVLDKLRLFREKRQSNLTFCMQQLTCFRFKPEYESETLIWNCRADRIQGRSNPTVWEGTNDLKIAAY
jgi:hypothetical protein